MLSRFDARFNCSLIGHLRWKSTQRSIQQSLTFPQSLTKRIQHWIRLLESESEALKELAKKQWEKPLELSLVKSEHRSMSGHHIYFSFSHGESSNEELLNCIRGKEPVQFWPKGNEKAELRGNMIMLNKEQNLLEVRLARNSMDTNNDYHQLLREHNKWNLKLIYVNMYQRLNKLLKAPSRLQKYPGYKVFQLAYKIGMDEKQQMKMKKDKLRMPSLSKELNQKQLEAVTAALNSSRPVVAIQGPPGTGKTKVISEIVYQSERKKRRVLVCAPTHKAVDNVMKSCKERGLKNFVRLGDSRSEDVLTEYHLGKRAEEHNEFKHLKKEGKLLNESYMLERDDQHLRRYKTIFKRHGDREDRIKQNIVEQTLVLFCTCTSGQAFHFLEHRWFKPDLVVMDEAAQLVECANWTMLLHAPRCVIVGDHHQLPPLLLSRIFSRNEQSFLEYLDSEFGETDCFHFLSIQYRSNELIQRWSNKVFYNDKLIANSSVKDSKLRDVMRPRAMQAIENPLIAGRVKVQTKKLLIDDPLVLIDTEKGISDNEWTEIYNFYNIPLISFQEDKEKVSYRNTGEALCAALHLRALHSIGRLNKNEIGCITPYFAQAECIRQLIKMDSNFNSKRSKQNEKDSLEVSTVDAFQGQEREAIVMSFVRNNPTYELGFLKEHRRTNVAITRAKRQFVLISSSKMLLRDNKLRELYGIFKTNGRIIGPNALLPGALEILMNNKFDEETNNKQKTLAA